MIYNELNSPAHRDSSGLLSNVEDAPWFLDVRGDSHVSPLDALLVINWLNSANDTAANVGFAFDVDQADEDDDDSEESPLSERRVDSVFA